MMPSTLFYMSISFSYSYLRNVWLGAWFAICRGDPRYFTRYYSVAILAGPPSSSGPGQHQLHCSTLGSLHGTKLRRWNVLNKNISSWLGQQQRRRSSGDNISQQPRENLVCEFANRTRLYWCKFRILRPSHPRGMSQTEWNNIKYLKWPPFV